MLRWTTLPPREAAATGATSALLRLGRGRRFGEKVIAEMKWKGGQTDKVTASRRDMTADDDRQNLDIRIVIPFHPFSRIQIYVGVYIAVVRFR